MSKRIFIAIISAIVLLFGSVFIASKSFAKSKSGKIDPAFKEFISAFTSGYVNSETKIQVVLKSPVNFKPEIGKEVENDWFDFSPSIKGKAVWINDKTIEFKPDERLVNGKTYAVSFALGDVMEVESKFKSFDFDFQVIPQALDIEIVGFDITDKQNYTTLNVIGVLNTADFASNEMVEKCLQANHGPKDLKITWNHQSSTQHRFIVNGVKKQNANTDLTLSYNGAAIGSDVSGALTQNIPALNSLVVMNTTQTHDPDQVVTLQCSEILKPNQTLEGLITISGSNNTFTSMISDNEIKIYPTNRIIGDKTLTVSNSIENKNGRSFQKDTIISINFEAISPSVRINSKGNILPSSDGLLFPFEAVNINAVNVKITKIYESNVLQFLQVNELNGSSELRRVGKTIVNKKVSLASLGSLPQNKWTKYALDLSTLIKAEPGAIYNVQLSFKKKYSIYDCNGVELAQNSTAEEVVEDDNEDKIEDEKDWDYYGSYYSYDYEYDDYYDYNYQERDNPCSSSYYRPNNTSVNKNILASNIGLIAKRASTGDIIVVATDLITTNSLSGIIIEAYDYQQKLITSKTTDGDGIAKLDLNKKPFVLVAKRGDERNYLKLDDGLTNSLSSFDVSGEQVQKGLKGFIYGERGVWRPGDSLFLNFILEDKTNQIPDLHPASLELVNPQGQVVQKITKTQNIDGFYNFATKTDNYAPTGTYMARVKIGGAVFTKNIRIETIMPNRLKLNLDFNSDMLYFGNGTLNGNLKVNWLHGAPGRNLDAKVDVNLTTTTTEFKNFKGYTFDSPSNSYYSEMQTIFNGKTDEGGLATVNASLNASGGAPGFLNANFTVRVFEEGGAFSTDRFSIPYSPYTHYVGIKTPEPNKETGYFVTDQDHLVKFATVDEKGNKVSRDLTVKVYKIQWRWWWDNYNEDLSSYIGSSYHQPISSEDITSSNGEASFKLRINQPEWGRYLVLVTDKESGHSAGKVMFIDWPAWAGKSPKGNEGVTMLNFTSDKTEYKVGESVKLSIPSAKAGKAFISIESGSRVIKTDWVETKEGTTDYNFKVTEEMTPNIYVYTTLIQPHAQSANDLPIRLYGVLPLLVKDENTILTPQIACADVWKPETTVDVSVKESQGKEMTYTLAVVDEGLLDITRFKTPDPWSAFYTKEALGVKTWDCYDNVIGAFGKSLQRILSIGGDGEGDGKQGSKAQRFKPMVRFIGPFTVKKGATNKHQISIPQYVGSVRVMVVAGKEGAYGKAEKTVAVRKPLMILSTLPRLLSPGEEVDLPVTVFAMEKKVKAATISIAPDKNFEVLSDASQTIAFNDIGDQVVNFKLKVRDNIGVAKVKISATGAGEVAKEEIEIEIRSANPMMTDASENTVGAGKSIKLNYSPLGINGTNNAVVEISSMPPINLQHRLNYLMAYPHGCVEQTTSSVFPQLYLTNVADLNDKQMKSRDANIKAGITRLKSFQTPSGGLSYWPGSNYADDWGTNYAGHFLIEAQKAGFTLPYSLLDNWKKYQKEKAQSWTATKNAVYYQEDLTQAYRLYTMALAGIPDLSSMNRLKEVKNLSITAKWRLAATYAKVGQLDVAKNLIKSLPKKVSAYNEMAYTYGSSYRDEAMILETLIALDKKTEAMESMKIVSTELSNNTWYSTQTTSYMLIAASNFISKYATDKGISAECKIGGITQKIESKKAIQQVVIANANSSSSITVTNKNKGLLYVRVIRSGMPTAGNETVAENNMFMTINYKSLKGETIDVSNLLQGTDFVAEITITHPGIKPSYKNLALTQIFPSGWEIHNARMNDDAASLKSDYFTYQDIRDDRIFTYFDLNQTSTKTFRVLLNAAYKGNFYLPSVYCETMYDNTINANSKGQWVKVYDETVIN